MNRTCTCKPPQGELIELAMNALGFNDAEKMHICDAGSAYELAALRLHGLKLWIHGIDCPEGEEE